MGVDLTVAAGRIFARIQVTVDPLDAIDLNKAFAARAIPTLLELGVDSLYSRVNNNGGGVALWLPPGMSEARIAMAQPLNLGQAMAVLALVMFCVGVGQGVAMLLERA